MYTRITVTQLTIVGVVAFPIKQLLDAYKSTISWLHISGTVNAQTHTLGLLISNWANTHLLSSQRGQLMIICNNRYVMPDNPLLGRWKWPSHMLVLIDTNSVSTAISIRKYNDVPFPSHIFARTVVTWLMIIQVVTIRLTFQITRVGQFRQFCYADRSDRKIFQSRPKADR